MRQVLIKVALIGLGFLAIIALLGFIHRNVSMSLGIGDFVSIRPASFWGSMCGSECKITWKSKSGETVTLALFDGRPEGPIIFMPLAEGNVLLCLYEYDVDLRLLKIETTNDFQPFPANNALRTIVLTSPCKVEEGNVEDWQTAMEYLKQLSPSAFKQQSLPGLDFGILRKYSDPEILLQRMTNQMKAMLIPVLR